VIAHLAGGGQTMVIVTHEIAFARRVAQRVVVVDAGLIVESGAPDDVLERPRNAATRALLAMR
jgi:polar amino acid transport system ATP-binding protein